jgi:hypothetical protein
VCVCGGGLPYEMTDRRGQKGKRANGQKGERVGERRDRERVREERVWAIHHLQVHTHMVVCVMTGHNRGRGVAQWGRFTQHHGNTRGAHAEHT